MDIPVASVVVTNVTLRWEYPGGDVDRYLIQYTQSGPNLVFNVTVDGDIMFIMLTGLEADATYSAVVFSVNSKGSSFASPLVSFDTPLCELRLLNYTVAYPAKFPG